MYVESEANGIRWCVPGDKRVTPVGRILRATHIDELPQLFNILKGKMSLVGPRPERPEIVAKLERVLPAYRRRLEVKPGLTGLAQVLQAPDTDLSMVRRKLELDLAYVDNWSLWLDLRLMIATIPHILSASPSWVAWTFRLPVRSDSLDPGRKPEPLPDLLSSPDFAHLTEAYKPAG